MFVEIHTVAGGAGDWTTLEDENGHTTDDTGLSCPTDADGVGSAWQSNHPFLAHYQTVHPDECDPTGTTGEWNAVTGNSGGWQEWSLPIPAAYLGQPVEIAVTVASDAGTLGLGTWIDELRVVDSADAPINTSDPSFESGMDGWTLPGPPAPPGPGRPVRRDGLGARAVRAVRRGTDRDDDRHRLHGLRLRGGHRRAQPQRAHASGADASRRAAQAGVRRADTGARDATATATTARASASAASAGDGAADEPAGDEPAEHHDRAAQGRAGDASAATGGASCASTSSSRARSSGPTSSRHGGSGGVRSRSGRGRSGSAPRSRQAPSSACAARARRRSGCRRRGRRSGPRSRGRATCGCGAELTSSSGTWPSRALAAREGPIPAQREQAMWCVISGSSGASPLPASRVRTASSARPWTRRRRSSSRSSPRGRGCRRSSRRRGCCSAGRGSLPSGTLR